PGPAVRGGRAAPGRAARDGAVGRHGPAHRDDRRGSGSRPRSHLRAAQADPPMTFTWPWLLLDLLLLPAAVAAYRHLLRRRAERTRSLAAQGLVTAAA